MIDLNVEIAIELGWTKVDEWHWLIPGGGRDLPSAKGWKHSVDAALRLPIESDAKWVLEVEAGRPVAHLIRTYGQNVWMGVSDKERTLAACMCKVWLLYRHHLRDYALAD